MLPPLMPATEKPAHGVSRAGGTKKAEASAALTVLADGSVKTQLASRTVATETAPPSSIAWPYSR
jgi:hypothetical protein